MIKGEKLIEEVRYVLLGQLHILEFMSISGDIVRASPLEVQQR